MKITRPDFYDSFRCIADKCTDSCCIGWEIDIDLKTYEKYQNPDGKLFEKLKQNIGTDTQPHFILTDNERCPFLCENGLCEMILTCGEESLCEICKEHPRFYEWYGNYKDEGVGLCCEESVTLLLANENPVEYITYETEEISDDKTDPQICDRVFSLREDLFEIISERSLPLSKRIEKCFLLTETDDINRECSNERFFEECIEIMRECEPFDNIWEEQISVVENLSFACLKEDFKAILKLRKHEYEKLFSYFIFRHFVKAAFDSEPDVHLKFCVMLLIFQIIFDFCQYRISKTFDFSERLFSTKYISKQFEYSEENIGILTDECAFNVLISTESINKFLNGLFI